MGDFVSLVNQLNNLRTRADNPSYRTIERIISRQRRPNKMARSTIQEKLAGNSPLSLTQVLSIVDALAEYARLHEIPLPLQEIEHEVWTNRLISSTSKGKSKNAPAANAPEENEASSAEWNVEPLRQAQMLDLVNLVTESNSKGTSTWLPRLLRDMVEAEMNISDFLARASQDKPLAVVETLKEMEAEFPYSTEDNPWGSNARSEQNIATVGALIRLVARHHGEESTPAVIVGMRRSRLGHHVEDYCNQVGIWFAPQRVVNIFDHLEKAALNNDIKRLAHSIAKHRTAKRIPEVVKLLLVAERKEIADAILQRIGSTNTYRIRNVVSELQDSSAPQEVLREIALGVPIDNHDEYTQQFEGSDLQGFADIMREAKKDVPPF